MRFFTNLLFYAAFLTAATSTQTALEKDALQWAESHLPQSGILKEEHRGFVYLKVDDDYIEHLFQMLENTQYEKPPYFRRSDSPGAHISVFYTDERNRTGAIKELGQTYSFKIIGFAEVPEKTHEYIVLQVESPQLEQLREKYGASPLLKGHKFHITIAKKKARQSLNQTS